MKNMTTRKIALSGVIAGLYAAVTLLTASFAYGNIQFRIAECLCVLVCVEPSVTIGLTLGCLIANVFSTVSVLDIIIGTAATLLACLLAVKIKNTWLAPLPFIFVNAILVGAMLAWVLAPETFWQSFALFGAEVAIGETAVLYLLGVPLLHFVRKSALVEKLLREANTGA